MIIHKPIFNTKKVEEIYSEKDGVPVKYVCTSATNEHATFACDVFYRETPHPEFGNRYFGLFYSGNGTLLISNADTIEDLNFVMIKDSKGDYHYSAHRHDYKVVEKMMIDGGRSYARHGGGRVYGFKVKDGEFVNDGSSDSE